MTRYRSVGRHKPEEDLIFLSATCLESSAVTVTIDAVALALMRTANEIADNTASDSADGRATPTIADNAANNCTRTCADRSPSLRRSTRRQCNNHSNRNDKLSHGSSPCSLHQVAPASMEHAHLSRVQAHIKAPLIFSPVEPGRISKQN
jgi:hypothetical protein